MASQNANNTISRNFELLAILCHDCKYCNVLRTY